MLNVDVFVVPKCPTCERQPPNPGALGGVKLGVGRPVGSDGGIVIGGVVGGGFGLLVFVGVGRGVRVADDPPGAPGAVDRAVPLGVVEWLAAGVDVTVFVLRTDGLLGFEPLVMATSTATIAAAPASVAPTTSALRPDRDRSGPRPSDVSNIA